MIKVISQSYYFLYIQRKIISYIDKCNLCHKIKLTRYKLYRKMKILLILNQL